MATDNLTKPAKTSLALRSLTTGETFALQGEMLVGREVECAIILNSRQISRYHAKILVAAHGVFIEDLHSSNGTYINGKRIDARTALALGDEVAFDEMAYRVTSRYSGAAAATQLVTPRQAAVAPPPPPPPPPPVYAAVAPAGDPPPSDPVAADPVAADPVVAEIPPAVAKHGVQANSTKMLTPERRAQIESVNQQFQRDVNAGSGPRLVVMTAPMRGQVFTLEQNRKGKEWLIGRNKDADIHIQEKSVSRDHARLIRLDTSYRILATKAANGIVVNGETKTASGLRHNDRIQIGRITLVFKTDEPVVQEDDEELRTIVRRRTIRSAVIAGFGVAVLLILLLIIVF